MKVTIHMTAVMDNDLWGVCELVDELDRLGKSEGAIQMEVLELAYEDLQALLDVAEFRVEIQREEEGTKP